MLNEGVRMHPSPLSGFDLLWWASPLHSKLFWTESWNFCPKSDGRSGSSGPLLPERNLTNLMYLTLKGAPVLTYRDFVLRKLWYYFASLRPHRKWLFYFVALSQRKLYLSFFFMAGPKSVWICCTYQRPKSPRKTIYHEFWRNRCVYLQTLLLM